MASVEHQCSECNFWDMDNTKLDFCPKCKSTMITNWFDEPEVEADDTDSFDDEE